MREGGAPWEDTSDAASATGSPSARSAPREDTPSISGIRVGRVGDNVKMDKINILEKQMGLISWPLQSRIAVNGTGTCLGATNDPKGCRLGHFPGKQRYDDFAKLANSALQSVLNKAEMQFTWSSLQVNCNCVSNLHCDSNNVGLSIIVLFGIFLAENLLRRNRGTKAHGTWANFKSVQAMLGQRISLMELHHTIPRRSKALDILWSILRTNLPLV